MMYMRSYKEYTHGLNLPVYDDDYFICLIAGNNFNFIDWTYTEQLKALFRSRLHLTYYAYHIL